MAVNVIIKVGPKQSDPSLYGNSDGTLVFCSLSTIPAIKNGAAYYSIPDAKVQFCCSGSWQNVALEINTVMRDNPTMTIATVPDYVDNAAAIAGGLTAGRIYRTGDSLKIVH